MFLNKKHMINAKVKILTASYTKDLETSVNEFLETIDIRQVVKMDFTATGDSDNKRIYCNITYVGIDDIRDAKIDNILDK